MMSFYAASRAKGQQLQYVKERIVLVKGLKVKGPMSKVTMSDLGLLDFLTFDQRFKIFSIAIFL
jgi:hypothetical protein